MSAHLSREDVLFHQRLLRQDGLYDGALDGLWGPKTMAADDERDEAIGWLILVDQGDPGFTTPVMLPPRTAGVVAGLTIAAGLVVRKMLEAIVSRQSPESLGSALLISGTRTYAEQSALFRRGRFGVAGPRVTNARAGQSWHNFGMAWDIGLFAADGSYIREEGPYREAGEWLMDRGIEGLAWGGHWKSFKDWPHYQLAVPWGITEMQRRFEAGIPLEER